MRPIVLLLSLIVFHCFYFNPLHYTKLHVYQTNKFDLIKNCFGVAANYPFFVGIRGTLPLYFRPWAPIAIVGQNANVYYLLPTQ